MLERAPFGVRHDDVEQTVALADVVYRADVRVVERGGQFGLALKRRRAFSLEANSGNRILMTTERSRRVSMAL